MQTSAPLWLEQCLLLAIAWTMIFMWLSVKPTFGRFLVALVPALLASTVVAMQYSIQPGERATITMFACVAAVIAPATLMMKHQLELLFPRARLVRRRR
jgi:hypothetical protein